jgi:hypothetical protein
MAKSRTRIEVKSKCQLEGHHWIPAAEGGILFPPKFRTVVMKQGSSSATKNKIVKTMKVYCGHCGKLSWKEEPRGGF